MANYSNLKAAIAAAIKQNGNQEITGQVLQDVLTSMVSVIGANYTFAGVATPATNPGTPDQNVFYLAMEGGTYTNFNGTVFPAGISLLMWNGTWTSKTVMCGDGGVFDISVYKSSGGTLATFADLAAALDGGNNIPASARNGGMSVKFVQSSDNKYVRFNYLLEDVTTAATFTNVDNWQGVDDEPTAGSDNLVKSGGIFKYGMNIKKYLLKDICFIKSYIDGAESGTLVEHPDLQCFNTGYIEIEKVKYVRSVGTDDQPSVLYFSDKNLTSYVGKEDANDVALNYGWSVFNGVLNPPSTARYCIVQINTNQVLENGEYYIIGTDKYDIDSILEDNECFEYAFKTKQIREVCSINEYIDLIDGSLVRHQNGGTSYHSPYIPVEYIKSVYSNGSREQHPILYFSEKDLGHFVGYESSGAVAQYEWKEFNKDITPPAGAKYCIIQVNTHESIYSQSFNVGGVFGKIEDDISDMKTDIQELQSGIGVASGEVFTYAVKGDTEIYTRKTVYSRNGRGMIYNMQLIGNTKNAVQLFEDFASLKINVYTDGNLYFSGKVFELCGMGLNIGDSSIYEDLTFSTPLFTKLGTLSGITLDYKIPYYSSVSVELERTSGSQSQMKKWITIKDTDMIDIEYGGFKIPEGAYLHSDTIVNASLPFGNQITLVDTLKNVMVLSEMISVVGVTNFQEGCVRLFKNGGNTPILISTGFEDYIGFCHYFDAGIQQTPMMGCTYFNMTNGLKLSSYRNHIDDILIGKSGGFKLTLRNGDQDSANMDLNTTNNMVGGQGAPANITIQSTYYIWD